MSAAYHTQQCHGQTGCHCASDHTEWVAELEFVSTPKLVAFWVWVLFSQVCTLVLCAEFLGCAWVRWGGTVAAIFN